MDDGGRMMQFLWTILVLGAALAVEMKDTREGEDLVLECRFSPHLTNQDPTLFWQRKNGLKIDNVIVQQRTLDRNYRLDYEPSLGRYDLRIINASYDRDNAEFECQVKATGSGQDLHSQRIQVTVLTLPGVPRVNPASPTATEGKNLELTCSSVGGSPDPIVRWYKDGLTYPLEAVTKPGHSRTIPTSAVLSLTPQRTDDGAVYRCVVWNRAMPEGQKLETTVKLNVNYFPRVSVGPENPLRVEKDATAVLQCNVDAKPAVNNVRWTRNGRFIATTFTHKLPRVAVQDAGSYVCTADNGLGQPGEANLTLDVLFPPVVAVEQRKEAEEGERVEVQCNVSANPSPVSVEWLREGRPEFRQSGETLRLSHVTSDHAGVYTCRAVNVLATDRREVERVGNASLSLRVRHKPGPSRIDPETPVAVEGGSVILTCGASPAGWPAPQYRWWRDGSEAAIATGARYHIPSAHLNTEGTYHCQASNDMGHGNAASVLLQVHQAPRFIAKLQPQMTKKAGDGDFSVTCGAQGKPKPAIRWMKDGEELKFGDMFRIVTDETEGSSGVATVQSSLVFGGEGRPGGKQLMPSDRGHYSCIFVNSVKQAETSMQLRIEHEPIVLHQYDKVAFDTRETAKVVCQVRAFPRPDFEWSFNGNRLQTGIGEHYELNATVLAEDVFRSVLVVSNIRDVDYGEYTCIARNNMGRLRTAIRLQPKGSPEKPSSLMAVSTIHNAVTLKWDPGFDGGLQDTQYFVSYRKIGAPDQMPGCEIAGQRSDPKEGREFDCQKNSTCNVTSLEPHYTYVFKVWARNTMGDSEYSEEVMATTQLDRFPVPQRVSYDPSNGQVAINLASTCLSLSAQVELRDEDGEWRSFSKIPVGGTTHKELTVPIGSPSPISTSPSQSPAALEFEDYVRVRLCLQGSDESMCGEYVKAEIGPMYISNTATIPTPTLIAIVVSCIVFVLFLAMIIVFCRCKRSQKKVKKEYEMETAVVRPNIVTQQPPPPYYSNGMDNKALEHSMDLNLDDPSKNPVYGSTPQNGYGYHNNTNSHNMNGGVPMAYIDSYSNSNNGGSVNSQDSLWQVKANGELQQQQQQQQQPQMAVRPYSYDPLAHGGYVDDYGHYPQVQDEYLNQRNRDYMSAAGDPYGPVHKPKKRMDHLDSPYHDVSGLPDPYAVEQDSDENKTQNMSLTFDESLESGYSTPNSRSRRVIREIIV